MAREVNVDDRRTYSLQITAKGRETLAEIGEIAWHCNESFCAALNAEERETLVNPLRRIADRGGLTPGVHPGFGRLGEKAPQAGLRNEGGVDR